MGEKRILLWFSVLADYTLGLLNVSYKNAKRQVTNQLPRELESAREYLDSCVIPLILKEQNWNAWLAINNKTFALSAQ